MGQPAIARLAKSRILSGLQCQRRLWLESYRRDLMMVEAAQQAVFDAGNALGDQTRSLFGPGTLIGHVREIDLAVAKTASLIDAQTTTLFEAAFRHQGVVVRADVLRRARSGYELIEVKGSGSVKDQYITDCAVQAWVIESAGLRIARTYLAHVDTNFVLGTAGDYRGLLVSEDITDAVRERIAQVPAWVHEFSTMLAGAEPDVRTGPHCYKPYGYPFTAHCRAREPAGPEYPIDILPRGGKVVASLRDAGFQDLRDVPADMLEKPIHQRVHAATVSGAPLLDEAARNRCVDIPYPRFYMDFETIGFTIPRWVGTRPFQQVPFQWSCHIEQRDGSITERAFLDTSGALPIEAFAESLLEAVGTDGAIVVYNQSFEAARIRELSEMLPALSASLLRLIDRMVDLLPIARDHYYHPAMKGSWSIKAVLPTIAPELSYDKLDEVADGGGAQLAYRESIAQHTEPMRRIELETALRRYCSNDTLAMVRVVAAFMQA